MRLFSPSQAKNARESDDAVKRARLVALDDEITRKNGEVARAEADFNATLARQNTQWATEEALHIEDVKRRKEEIVKLTEQRRVLLVPIDSIREQAETTLKEAATVLANAQRKEAEAEQTSEILESRLDDLGEQKTKADERDKALDRRARGIDEQAKQANAMTERLNDDLRTFVAKATALNQEYDRKNKELELREIAVASREKEVEARRAKQAIREKAINDKYATFERNLKRNGKRTEGRKQDTNTTGNVVG